MREEQIVRRRRYVAVIYGLIVLAISSIPGDALPDVPDVWGIDKFVHLILYAGLGFLMLRGFDPEARRIWLIVCFSVAYGLLDEAHQWLIPGRTPSLLDALADALGSVVGVLIAARQLNRGNSGKQPDPGTLDK